MYPSILCRIYILSKCTCIALNFAGGARSRCAPASVFRSKGPLFKTPAFIWQEYEADTGYCVAAAPSSVGTLACERQGYAVVPVGIGDHLSFCRRPVLCHHCIARYLVVAALRAGSQRTGPHVRYRHTFKIPAAMWSGVQ